MMKNGNATATKTYFSNSNFAQVDVEGGKFFLVNMVTGTVTQKATWAEAKTAQYELHNHYYHLERRSGW